MIQRHTIHTNNPEAMRFYVTIESVYSLTTYSYDNAEASQSSSSQEMENLINLNLSQCYNLRIDCFESHSWLIPLCDCDCELEALVLVFAKHKHVQDINIKMLV